MAKLNGITAKVEKHISRKVPQRIFGIETKKSKGDPKSTAISFLKTIAPSLKINKNLSDLKFDKVKDSILGKHVLFQQYLKGKQISGAWIRVDIDNDGKVYNVQNDLLPEGNMEQGKLHEEKKLRQKAGTTDIMKQNEAVKFAYAAINTAKSVKPKLKKSELLYLPVKNLPTLSWKFLIQNRIKSSSGIEKTKPATWKVYVDARTGKILKKKNVLKDVTGKGWVFDPNPVVSLNDFKLREQMNIPENAYKVVDLKNLSKSGYLDGPFATTKPTKKRVINKKYEFLFTRKRRGFKEVMVYFHIHRIQDYIQSLGFKNVLNKQIEVNIDGTRADNSYYDPGTKSLTFGTGGVDDAEDAEIILHEYGHAIQDDQVPGFGEEMEGRAMGEGFGDYLAASFFADLKSKEMRPTFASWDIRSKGARKTCLRRLDSKKKYPKDYVDEEHDDGEIWSACLWQLRSELGRKTTDTLVIASHFLLTREAKFKDGAEALLTTDRNLNKGRNETKILSVFKKRGILPNYKRRIS